MFRIHTLPALVLAACLLSGPTFAREVAGVDFPDHTSVAGRQLVLNGAGERSIPLLKGYAVAMYLPQRQHTREGALDADGPKRLQITTLIDAPPEALADALARGVRKNATDAETVSLAERLEAFTAAFEHLPATPRGTVIRMDWLPASGTRLSVDGRPVGNDIPGEDFYRALLRVWLGERPVTKALRDALLGRAP